MSLLLRPAPLLTLAALTLCIAACLYSAPFGLFPLVILVSWTFKYSIALLDALGQGAKAMPVLSSDMILGSLRHWRLLIVLALATALFFIVSTSLQSLGRILLVLLAAATPIALPAILMVQTWTHDTRQAFTPSVGLSVARLLGTDYLRLVAIIAVLVIVTVFVLTRAPSLPLRAAACVACWFATLVFVGQVLHSRQKDFAGATIFAPPPIPIQTAQQLATARERAADEIYAHWRSGAEGKAWTAVEKYVQAGRHPAEELLWLQRRVALWKAESLHQRISAALQEALRRPDDR